MKAKAFLRRRVLARRGAVVNERKNSQPAYGTISPGVCAGGSPFVIPEAARTMHTHIMGSTGVGKTNLLEHLIRQDILNGRGVALLNPHGGDSNGLNRRLLAWLADTGLAKHRRIRLIEPENGQYVLGFNPLKGASGVAPSVTSEAVLGAFERLSGDEDMNAKHTILRMLTALFAALCELRLSLWEGAAFLDIDGGADLRQWAIANVSDHWTKQVLAEFDATACDARREARMDAIGPLNRLARLLRAEATRLMVAETDCVIDLAEAMDAGDIILANLQPGRNAGSEAVRMVGLLLVRELFEQAPERRNRRPFHLYIDECHQYLSGDIPDILDGARKWGLHATLSHQRLGQLLDAGDNIYNGVMGCAHVKIVMGGLTMAEAKTMAEDIVPLDLERPVETLNRPTVVGHDVVRFRNRSHGRGRTEGSSYGMSWSRFQSESETVGGSSTVTESESHSDSSGQSNMQSNGDGQSYTYEPGSFFWQASNRSRESGRGHTETETESHTTSVSVSSTNSWSESSARGTSEAANMGVNFGTSETEGWGESEALRPLLADLPSAVHSKENMLYAAARALRELPRGKAIVAIGAQRPVAVSIPHVRRVFIAESKVASLREEIFESDPAVRGYADAKQALENRQHNLARIAFAGFSEEPELFREPAPRPSRQKQDDILDG